VVERACPSTKTRSGNKSNDRSSRLFEFQTTNTMTTKNKTILDWIFRILLAALFLMAALPKLTGDPMAAAMIDKLGVGSWAGPVIGLAELTAAILLLVPKTVVVGAALALVVLVGAILSHLTVLGISLGEEDGGSMFAMASVGLVVSGVLLYMRKDAVKPLLQKA